MACNISPLIHKDMYMQDSVPRPIRHKESSDFCFELARSGCEEYTYCTFVYMYFQCYS